MATFDLTNKNISDTFQNLLQKTGSDGRLYDLMGTPVRDLRIDGTLIANTYITSQSIVNTSSGSTAFGNSADDSHHFSGSITASGNISASGYVYGDRIYAEDVGFAKHAAGGIGFGTSTSLNSLQHITASGNISASGTVLADIFESEGRAIAYNVSNTSYLSYAGNTQRIRIGKEDVNK